MRLCTSFCYSSPSPSSPYYVCLFLFFFFFFFFFFLFFVFFLFFLLICLLMFIMCGFNECFFCFFLFLFVLLLLFFLLLCLLMFIMCVFTCSYSCHYVSYFPSPSPSSFVGIRILKDLALCKDTPKNNWHGSIPCCFAFYLGALGSHSSPHPS